MKIWQIKFLGKKEGYSMLKGQIKEIEAEDKYEAELKFQRENPNTCVLWVDEKEEDENESQSSR